MREACSDGRSLDQVPARSATRRASWTAPGKAPPRQAPSVADSGTAPAGPGSAPSDSGLPTEPSPHEGRRRGPRLRYTLPGMWVALVFACLSFTPSLLPRTGLVQGALVGITGATGYGVGVVGAWVWRAFADREARPASRRSWQVFTVVAAIAIVVSVVQGQRWAGPDPRSHGRRSQQRLAPRAADRRRRPLRRHPCGVTAVPPCLPGAVPAAGAVDRTQGREGCRMGARRLADRRRRQRLGARQHRRGDRSELLARQRQPQARIGRADDAAAIRRSWLARQLGLPRSRGPRLHRDGAHRGRDHGPDRSPRQGTDPRLRWDGVRRGRRGPRGQGRRRARAHRRVPTREPPRRDDDRQRLGRPRLGRHLRVHDGRGLCRRRHAVLLPAVVDLLPRRPEEGTRGGP